VSLDFFTRYELIQIIIHDAKQIEQRGLAVIDPDMKKRVVAQERDLLKKPMNSSHQVTQWSATRLLEGRIKGFIIRPMPNGMSIPKMVYYEIATLQLCCLDMSI
jgi:hypothetical protein